MTRLFTPRPDSLLGQLRSPLYAGEHMLDMRICDNGRGGLAAHGNGVSGMRERVRALGGTLAIESPPRRGTVLAIQLPLPARATVASDARIVLATHAMPAAGSAA